MYLSTRLYGLYVTVSQLLSLEPNGKNTRTQIKIKTRHITSDIHNMHGQQLPVHRVHSADNSVGGEIICMNHCQGGQSAFFDNPVAYVGE